MAFEQPLHRISPLAGNEFKTREDVEGAFLDLFNPLLKAFSPGGARVRLDDSAAHFEQAASDLEGFARPLWGIVPYAYGGGKFEHWELYRTGLANGTDPSHPEYWGEFIKDRPDQRLVEMAAVGFALALVPEYLYHPLTDKAKENVKEYLSKAAEKEFVNNNWKFFRVLIIMGLVKINGTYNESALNEYLTDIDNFYIGNGWYGDGPRNHIDHYNGFAFHFYGLVYSVLAKERDPDRAQTYQERAKLFANQFRHWFSEDGASLPFGRSLTYRFAQASFWSGLAFADITTEDISWGKIKGIYLRHMRWWARQRLSRLDSGVLSVGYSYPQAAMHEPYNSAQSPYWAMKAFAVLALPSTHPFWTSKEEDPSGETLTHLDVPGMIISHQKMNTTAFVSGPTHVVRKAPEKYGKFVYSTRYGFSVEDSPAGLSEASVDGMMALSCDNGETYKVREKSTVCKIFNSGLYSEWHPWDDVKVKTWLIVKENNWHIRVHKIHSPNRRLQTKEGGFAISNLERDGELHVQENVSSLTIKNQTDYSIAVDLNTNRKTSAYKSQPNTNLLFSKCIIPQLSGLVNDGEEVVFAAAFNAGVSRDYDSIGSSPEIPDLEELEQRAKDADFVKCTV